MAEDVKVLATNRKATFEYFLLEKFEAGLALQGSEIKSIRAGQISIQESYVDIENGEQAWLVEAHIAPYAQANRFNHEPRRRRRLLLQKSIRELGTISASKADVSHARFLKNAAQRRDRAGKSQDMISGNDRETDAAPQRGRGQSEVFCWSNSLWS